MPHFFDSKDFVFVCGLIALLFIIAAIVIVDVALDRRKARMQKATQTDGVIPLFWQQQLTTDSVFGSKTVISSIKEEVAERDEKLSAHLRLLAIKWIGDGPRSDVEAMVKRFNTPEMTVDELYEKVISAKVAEMNARFNPLQE